MDKLSEIILNTPKEELQVITGCIQPLKVDELEMYLNNHSKILKKYLDLLPEIIDLYLLMEERRNYLSNNEKYTVNYIFKQVNKSSEHKDIDNRIKKVQKKLISRLNEIVSIINLLKQEGQLKPEEAHPNKESNHFHAAQELANQLTELWFIDKVILFGSVAKGNQRPDSDIDLFLGVVPKRKARLLERLIEKKVYQVTEKYKDTLPKRDLFDCVKLKEKDFKKLGFFEATVPLFEKNNFIVTINENRYEFTKASLIEYHTNTRSWETQLVLYPGSKDNNYKAVWIKNFTPIANLDVHLLPRGNTGLRMNVIVKDFQATEEVDKLKIVCQGDVHSALKRLHKDKRIIYGNFEIE